MLAGLTKGPSLFQSRPPSRARPGAPRLCAQPHAGGRRRSAPSRRARRQRRCRSASSYARPHRDTGFHFVDQLGREAKTLAGIDSLTAQSYTVRSTINAQLQRDAEAALQEGLGAVRAERRPRPVPRARGQHRATPSRRSADRAPARHAGLAAGAASGAAAALRRALDAGGGRARRATARRTTATIRVGLPDGRILPLTGLAYASRRGLSLYDVVYVNVVESRAARFAPRSTARQSRQAEAARSSGRRNCGRGRRCRARPWCWRTRPAASSRWPAASPIR